MLLLVSIALAAGVLLATRRYGSRQALLLTGLLCVATAVAIEPTVGLAPLMGLIAGVQVERQRSYGEVVVVASIPGGVLSLWLLLDQQESARRELVDELTRQLEGMGMQVAEGGYTLHEMIAGVLRVRPAIEFVTLLLTVVLAYRVGLWGAQRMQVALPAARPFHLWRPWDELIWGMIGALGLGLIGSGVLEDLALNLVVVMVILYAVQGLALLRFFMLRLGISKLLELLVYALLFFTSGLALISLAGLGLLETWFDWRRLRPVAPAEDGD